MPEPIRRPFYLCSGLLRRQVGFVQDQVPNGFVFHTVCEVSGTGRTKINVTENFAHYYDAEERMETVQAILRTGLLRGVLRLMKQQDRIE